MRDEAFRVAQDAGRYAQHVRAINALVDELRREACRGWVPHVAACHAGVGARMLSVLRDPGPMTVEATGSGFLCIENDDPTAENQCHAFAEVGIAAGDFTPWNAYPWYINRAPTTAERQVGVVPLLRLIDLLPHLRVVLLQGRDAQDTWDRAVRQRPDLTTDNLEIIRTYHPSPQALRSPDPAIREQRCRDRGRAYQRAAAALHRIGETPPSEQGT